MLIYLVTTKDKVNYDEYDAIVVIATSEEHAVRIASDVCSNFGSNLDVKQIGIANDDQACGEVLASFNAG